MSDEQKPANKSTDKQDMQRVIADAVATAVKEAIAGVTAAQINAAERVAQNQRDNADKVRSAITERCSVCRQVMKACGGPATDENGVDHPEKNHVKMVVFPASDADSDWFQGIRINTVTYLSSGPNHEIWVPAKNDIKSMITIWENNEREMKQGRKAEHFSGIVSPAGFTSRHPASGGWR